MLNRKDEIKQENKKSFRIFLIILILSSLTGGVLGILAVIGGEDVAVIMADVSIIMTWLAPYLMIVFVLVFNIFEVVMYKKSRNLFQAWDGEDEETARQIDMKTGYAMWAIVLNIILSSLLFALSMNFQVQSFENLRKVPILLAVSIINMFLTIWLQRKTVDLVKEMNPEKQGSIYDIKFQDKWLKSCDEAEKMQIYESAYSSYKITNTAMPIAWVITALGTIFAWTGPFACIIVSVLWAIQSSVYCYKSIQFSK